MIRFLFALSSFPHRDIGRPYILSVVSAVVQGAGLALLVPFVIALLHGDLAAAGQWLAAMAGVLALYGVVQYRTQLACYSGGMRLAVDVFSRLSLHIAALPLGWFDADRVGQVCQLMSKGVVDVMAVPAHQIRPIIGAFVTPAAVLGFMLYYDWRIGLVALLAAPLLWGSYRLTGYLAAKAEHASHESASEVNARIVEFSTNQAMLRAYDREDLGRRLLVAALSGQRRAGHRLLRLSLPGIVLCTIAMQIFFGAVIGVSVRLALGGAISLAVVAALLVLAVRFIEPLAAAVDMGASVRITRNLARRMTDILDTPVLPEPERSLAGNIPPLPGLVFDNVHFAYADAPVLNGVSFRAEPGRVTALVGPSGAGKTTLLQLAARFRDVDGGSIRLGDTDIRDLGHDDLMRRISFVFQNVYLYNGTIRENILVGDETGDASALAEAITLAGIDEMLSRLPGGLDTVVGEGGAALSGGERQRISIARAILKKSPVLLLDEVTSALDAHNQSAIQKTIATLRGERTIVVIAHRLSTVENADAIVVLNGQGRVDDIGTHAELLLKNGLYRKFNDELKASRGWRL